MAMGVKARDPATPYKVYEFSMNGRVYYTGIGQVGSTRATDRWNYVCRQLERLKTEGTLPTGKMRDIQKTSGAVIKALVERNAQPHQIHYPWRGSGRAEALRQEAKRIEALLSNGCVLANVIGNPRPATARDVLSYLGYE